MDLPVDRAWLLTRLEKLLATPSPTGMTEAALAYCQSEAEGLGFATDRTRRGALRIYTGGDTPVKAVAAHVDTLGAMVRELKPNGRLALSRIGHWSPRFAEGGRVTLVTDGERFRGTVLPLKASGHVYNDEVDQQPVSWDQLELRVDLPVASVADLEATGIQVGDFVAFDAGYELAGPFVNARHLDDKGGVAACLAALHAMRRRAAPETPGVILLTPTEEVGTGASAGVPPSVEELVGVDNGTAAPGQSTSERGVTFAMMDMAGPFDRALTRRLEALAQQLDLPRSRDVFRYYRSDVDAAVEAGVDARVALIAFGVDASHGYERVHVDSLVATASLVAAYLLA